jgi:hypothetical protein
MTATEIIREEEMVYRAKPIFVLISFSILLLVSPSFDLSGANYDGTLIPTMDNVVDTRVLPTHLFCDKQSYSGLGASWEDVQIGTSTLEDLQKQVDNLSPNYIVSKKVSIDADIQFYLNDINERQLGNIPYSIKACIRNNIITALSLGLSLNSNLFLSTYISMYGIPDAVVAPHYLVDR